MLKSKQIKWIVDEKTGCHNCISHIKDKHKYPKIHSFQLTRYLWEQKNGTIPKGSLVCHRCDNPSCINIEHLFLGTQSQNMLDSVNKGRARCLRTNGENSNFHKLTKEQVIEIRFLKGLTHLPNAEIAKGFDITKATIRDICQYKTWRTVP